MTPRNLTYQECVKHSYSVLRHNTPKDDLCGCPRTTRTHGLVIYKSDVTGNWIVWDVIGQTWLSLCGDWQTAMTSAHEYLADYPPEPIRCQSRCSQWPNCQHDWRSWHKYAQRPPRQPKPDIVTLPADTA